MKHLNTTKDLGAIVANVSLQLSMLAEVLETVEDGHEWSAGTLVGFGRVLQTVTGELNLLLEAPGEVLHWRPEFAGAARPVIQAARRDLPPDIQAAVERNLDRGRSPQAEAKK